MVQAKVRGNQARDRYRDMRRAEYKTLSSGIKKFNDDKTYNLFMMGKMQQKEFAKDEIVLRVILREIKNFNLVNEISITSSTAVTQLYTFSEQGVDPKLKSLSFTKNVRAV